MKKKSYFWLGGFPFVFWQLKFILFTTLSFSSGIHNYWPSLIHSWVILSRKATTIFEGCSVEHASCNKCYQSSHTVLSHLTRQIAVPYPHRMRLR